MLENRRHLPAYNEGIVEIFDDAAGSSSFGAKANPRRLAELVPYATLRFSVESMRERDVQLAQQQGVSVTLKLKCPYLDGISAKQKAVIDGRVYDITRVDPSKRDSLYIYLGGGRVLQDGRESDSR